MFITLSIVSALPLFFLKKHLVLERGGQDGQLQYFLFHLFGQNFLLSFSVGPINISCYKESTGCVMLKIWTCVQWPLINDQESVFPLVLKEQPISS